MNIFESPLPYKRNNLKIEIKQIFRQLFYDGISEKDVDQGLVGNCYFAATVAAIAFKKPDIIKKIIKTIDNSINNLENQYQLYFYQLLDNGNKKTIGEKKFITVDNKLYVAFDEKPIYGSSENSSEIWYSIFEKAYASFKNNSYEEIGKGGIPANTMMEILGTEAKTIKLDSNLFKAMIEKEEDRKLLIWNYIKERFKDNIIVLASLGSGETKNKENPNIFSGHAYSVHEIFERDNEHYLLLRNPWGNHRIRNYDAKKDDGFFIINKNELIKYFSYISICNI